MWGDEIRRLPDGPGVPRVAKISYESIWTNAQGERQWECGVGWEVTYPDKYEFDCCNLTEAKLFKTWTEARAFALERKWER